MKFQNYTGNMRAWLTWKGPLERKNFEWKLCILYENSEFLAPFRLEMQFGIEKTDFITTAICLIEEIFRFSQ